MAGAESVKRRSIVKRPAAGAGSYNVGLLRIPRHKKDKLPHLALERETPLTYYEYNPKGCPKCWSPDIRTVLALKEAAWWGCLNCRNRWFAYRDDPAKIVRHGVFPGIPQRVVASIKAPTAGGLYSGQSKLKREVLKAPIFPLYTRW